jgi:hypothetical protein
MQFFHRPVAENSTPEKMLMRVPGGKYPAMPWRNGFLLTGGRCAQAADVTVIAARLQKLRNGLATKPTVQPANLKQCEEASKLAQEHLATFDTLDYDAFLSGAEWDRLKETFFSRKTICSQRIKASCGSR